MLLPWVSCGYRPLTPAIPGDVESLRVLLPDPGSSSNEPELPKMLVHELIQQLARCGVKASAMGSAQAMLRTKIVALSTKEALLSSSRKALAGRTLCLVLEVWLTSSEDKTLWRSRLVEVCHTSPLSATSTLSSEGARRFALQQLAVRAAEQAIDLLTSGL